MAEPLEPTAGSQPTANAGDNGPPHESTPSPTQVQTQVQGQQAPDFDALFQHSQDEEQDQGTPFDVDVDPDATPIEVVRKVSRHFSFLLAPLLFALVTFLLTFLFLVVLKDNHFLPPSGLWSIGLIVLALAVLQGMLLYYSGTNNGYWFLSLLLGFVLFPAALFFAIAGLSGCLIVLVVMFILCGVAAKFSMHRIQDGHVGLVYSFGKYRRTLSPGMNFLPPWEHISYMLDTRETQWTCPSQTVPMSPKDDLALAATITYHIIPEDAHYAVQQVNGWETQLHERFRATVQSVALEFRPEDFYAWQQNTPAHTAPGAQAQPDPPAWNRMNSRLFQIMRDMVSAWGVQINWVRIHDVTPLPHVDRADAMRAHINAAPARPMAAGGSRPGPLASQPAAARGQAKPQPAPAVPARPVSVAASAPAPAAASATAAASNGGSKAKDEVLLKAYEAVRNGSITDPETIRRIATRFDAIAHDPVANQSFPFDAQRAARNLYEQARYHEDRISASAEYGYSEQDNYNDPDFDDFSGTTEPNWERPTGM